MDMKRVFLVLEKILIIILFSTSIYLPFFVGIFAKDVEVSNAEKRKLSPCPNLPKSLQSIKDFPGLFEKYYADHFGLRNYLTKYYNFVKYKVGDSPSEYVTIGKDGWLFLGSIKQESNAYLDPIGDYRNENLYSQENLHRFSERMTALKSWLNKRGIEYLFVIAPNKHTVYHDKLPSYITKVNKFSATDQLVGYLNKHTDVSVVDLRQELIQAKSKHQLYEKTGTHWNHYGANIAQYIIMLELEKLFPKQMQPQMMPLQDGMLTIKALRRMMGVPLLREQFPKPIFEEKTCKPIRDPKGVMSRKLFTMICETQKFNAVIFRDSFFTLLQPYFSRKFKRSTYIWQKLNYSTLKKYTELEKPDVIIEEWVERKLPYTPKEDIDLYKI
ncbi:MAG: hypothetical protein D3916_00765 [Candidatus Electrothrix sp. MAN1_4]|nr:hypothetical protein [Candidatus Electrothrix sp. MAN1_4]